VIVEDLLNDIELSKQCDYQLVLATKTVNGKRIDEPGAQLRTVGAIELDDSDNELKFVPNYMPSEEGSIAIATVLDLNNILRDSHKAHIVFGVDRRKELPDGSKASLNMPLVGTYFDDEDQEVWLLQGPIEQWS